jgi:hypothetical protein
MEDGATGVTFAGRPVAATSLSDIVPGQLLGDVMLTRSDPARRLVWTTLEFGAEPLGVEHTALGDVPV